jgi:hypothetical protein
MRTSDEESFDHYPSSAYNLEACNPRQQLQQQMRAPHQKANELVVEDVQKLQPQQQLPPQHGQPVIDRSFDLMLHSSMDFGTVSSSSQEVQGTAACPNTE